MSVKDVVANTEQSVVEITTETAAKDSYFQQMVTTGAGSGVIISKDGYIVTNHHVIDGANKITVRTKDGSTYDAKLIGKDSMSDLAVLKIDAEGLIPALFGSSDALSVGDEAIAIGNPLGELGGTVTRGIISALDREITIDGQTMTLLQTDTAINKGNSGGGLFNSAGELVGIVNAKSSGTSVEGLGFAIPIDTAKPIIESLIASGYVTGRPQLGVSMVTISDELSAFQAGVSEMGVYVAKVNDHSAASQAGIQVKDRIVSIDGNEITSSADAAAIIAEKQVGDTITIIVMRDRKSITLNAVLQEAQPQE
ncbi:MAG: trypsin-like serine protease [Erysipelotrichaceae bacterium]|nr:trypsin-like serine protease [Erysipelotrichaceae bacterium]